MQSVNIGFGSIQSEVRHTMEGTARVRIPAHLAQIHAAKKRSMGLAGRRAVLPTAASRAGNILGDFFFYVVIFICVHSQNNSQASFFSFFFFGCAHGI